VAVVDQGLNQAGAEDFDSPGAGRNHADARHWIAATTLGQTNQRRGRPGVVEGTAVERRDGVTNGGAVSHDLRGRDLGVEQLGQGVIVAGEIAVSAGQVDLMRD
jgi:hypothetical protein